MTVCSEPITLNTGFNAILGQSVKTIKSAIMEAVETMGYQVHFVEQPWRRCIQMVRNNIVDTIFASVWQKERSEWMQYPLNKAGQADTARRIWVSHYSIFTTKESQLSWDGEAFSGITHGIGSPLGYVLTDQLKTFGVLNKHVNSAEAGFKLVARGLLDGFAIERSIGYSHIEALQLQYKIVEHPIAFSQQNLYAPLSKKFYQEDPARGERFFDLVAEYYQQSLQ